MPRGGDAFRTKRKNRKEDIYTKRERQKTGRSFQEGWGVLVVRKKKLYKKKGALSAKNKEGRKYTHKIGQKKIERNFPSGKVHG